VAEDELGRIAEPRDELRAGPVLRVTLGARPVLERLLRAERELVVQLQKECSLAGERPDGTSLVEFPLVLERAQGGCGERGRVGAVLEVVVLAEALATAVGGDSRAVEGDEPPRGFARVGVEAGRGRQERIRERILVEVRGAYVAQEPRKTNEDLVDP